MEEIPYHPLIIITKDNVKKVRQLCELDDPKRINESIDIVEEWVKKQAHLAGALPYLGRHVIERVYIIAKGSVELTKTRLERLLTSRGLMPELCLNRSVEEFEPLWDCLNYVPLPKLNPSDQARVMVTQFNTDKLEPFSILTYFRYSFLIGEYRINYDYTPSERFIVDLTNVNLSVISKINPIVVKKAEVLCTEGIGTKIKGIHILNAPPFIDKLIFLLKQALREKVANRVHVHSSYEDLQKHIPKEILPKDYGGDETSVSKMSEQWKEMLRSKEARKFIEDSENIISDETKRHAAKFNEEYMGMPGSFRKLTVD